MSRYAGIIYNDTAAAPGLSLSFYTQGCPFQCAGCHNPETWDFEGGFLYTEETLHKILDGLRANGINRSLSILGGEPLAKANLKMVREVIENVKYMYPDTLIYLWTGYNEENIRSANNEDLLYILYNIDCLIDGPYIESLRDVTLPLRGSSNQRIFCFTERGKKAIENLTK